MRCRRERIWTRAPRHSVGPQPPPWLHLKNQDRADSLSLREGVSLYCQHDTRGPPSHRPRRCIFPLFLAMIWSRFWPSTKLSQLTKPSPSSPFTYSLSPLPPNCIEHRRPSHRGLCRLPDWQHHRQGHLPPPHQSVPLRHPQVPSQQVRPRAWLWLVCRPPPPAIS